MTTTTSHSTDNAQKRKSPLVQPYYTDYESNNIVWVYYRHPSGRVHRLNPNETLLIHILVSEGWVRVVQP